MRKFTEASSSVLALEIWKLELHLSLYHIKKAHGLQPPSFRRRKSSAGRSELWWRWTVSDSHCSSFLARPLPPAPLLSCMQLMPEESKPTRHSSCFRPSSGCGPWRTLWDAIRNSPSTMKPPPPPWKLSVLRTFQGCLQVSLSICQLWTLIIASPPNFSLNAYFEDV